MILSSFISSCGCQRPEIDFECECFRLRVACLLFLFVCLFVFSEVIFRAIVQLLRAHFLSYQCRVSGSKVCSNYSGTWGPKAGKFYIIYFMYGIHLALDYVKTTKPRFEHVILCRTTSVNSRSSGNQKNSRVRYLKVLTIL